MLLKELLEAGIGEPDMVLVFPKDDATKVVNELNKAFKALYKKWDDGLPDVIASKPPESVLRKLGGDRKNDAMWGGKNRVEVFHSKGWATEVTEIVHDIMVKYDGKYEGETETAREREQANQK